MTEPGADPAPGSVAGAGQGPAGSGRPRVALVLGAGGVTGHAFHAGVLSVLAEEIGFDPGAADLLVGTSAGSVVAALLRAGLTASDLAAGILGGALSARARELYGARRPGRSGAWADYRRPFRPGFASPGLLAGAALRPWRMRPGAVLAGLLPRGQMPTGMISDWLRPVFPGRWPPPRPGSGLWICAVALANGRRTVFGREGSPGARVPEAVAASCAIPGFFAPVEIGGVSYVDGGVHSATNADLVAGGGFDLVLVSSPMSAARPLGTGLEMAGRRLARLNLSRELASVRRRGTKVLAFQPTPADRAVMGVNAMDPSRREAVARQVRDSTRARLARPDVAERLALLVGLA